MRINAHKHSDKCGDHSAIVPLTHAQMVTTVNALWNINLLLDKLEEKCDTDEFASARDELYAWKKSEEEAMQRVFEGLTNACLSLEMAQRVEEGGGK